VSVVKAVIPAAGRGTRLYPATKSQPKEMLPLGPRPTIQRVAEELVDAGVLQMLIVTGHSKRAIEDHFDPAEGVERAEKCPACAKVFDNGLVRFFYTRQSEPRGLGDAVLQASDFVGDADFVVALGDSVIVSPESPTLLERLIATHEATNAAATIAVYDAGEQGTRKYGIIAPAAESNGGLRITGIVEKPGPQRAPSRLAVCARYCFSPKVFEYLAAVRPGLGGEVQLTDAIQAMISDGLAVYAVPLGPGEFRMDVGDFVSYGRAFIRTMLTHEDFGEPLKKYCQDLLQYLECNDRPDPDLH
jgi:UTP--glucose-1-phosphate uridylyltransferase